MRVDECETVTDTTDTHQCRKRSKHVCKVLSNLWTIITDQHRGHRSNAGEQADIDDEGSAVRRSGRLTRQVPALVCPRCPARPNDRRRRRIGPPAGAGQLFMTSDPLDNPETSILRNLQVQRPSRLAISRPNSETDNAVAIALARSARNCGMVST